MDSIVGKVLGLVCGSRFIKTARELFKQLKGLQTMGYGTDFLKTYEHLIPTALHHQGKTFTLRSNHSIVNSGITSPITPENVVLQ